MHIKIQSQGIAGGANIGSCKNYVQYLEHENTWKKKNDMSLDIIPFFDRNATVVTSADVQKSIDQNKANLHYNDAKFFSCIISFSDKEITSMGESREDKITSAHTIVGKFMDRYAKGFGAEGVNSRNDILYYYTVHEYREKEDGKQAPGLHVHLIISRKDIRNKRKLSPMTCYKSGASGVIKRGFNRDEFYRDCEAIFDSTFNHKRSVPESYDYCNAIAHGTEAEKELQIQRATEEKRIAQTISAALTSRINRLAQEAIKYQAHNLAREQTRLRVEDKARRNKFWNEYFTYYKPQMQSLKKSCTDAFKLYSDAKDKYKAVHKETSEMYQNISVLYTRMKELEEQIQKATTSKRIITAISALIAFSNPIPAIIISFVSAMIFNTRARIKVETKRDLRRRAAAIYEDIKNLKEQQSKLSNVKDCSLKEYLKVKDEKTALQDSLKKLKEELEKPLEENTAIINLAKRYAAYSSSLKSNLPANDKSISSKVSSFILSATTKLSLDNLLSQEKLLLNEVTHANGGVADFMITDEVTQKTFSINEVIPTWKMVALLDKWEKLTGKTPAYRVDENNNQQKEKKTTIKIR